MSRPDWLSAWQSCLADPNHLVSWLKQYLLALQFKNYSEFTIDDGRRKLLGFIQWCTDRDLHTPQDITPPILDRYRRHLFYYRGKRGALKQRTQHAILVMVRGYFSWLTRQKVLMYNPASELILPRLNYELPKAVPTSAQVEQMLSQIDLSEPLGLRDRSMLETLYSTGIRRREVAGLQLNDVDMDRGMVLVRQGKGAKDRCIAIGDRALAWLDKYLVEQRPFIHGTAAHATIYVSFTGLPIHPADVTRRVSKYMRAADLDGSCHRLRHSMATAMLENGADIRYIQTQLGHANLKSTQIYTQVTNLKLKEVHSQTHPARLTRQDDDQEPEG